MTALAQSLAALRDLGRQFQAAKAERASARNHDEEIAAMRRILALEDRIAAQISALDASGGFDRLIAAASCTVEATP